MGNKNGNKQENNKKIKPGIAMDKNLIERIDRALEAAQVDSRNEFIDKAVRFYLGYLTSREAGDYIYIILYNMIQGAISHSEQKIINQLELFSRQNMTEISIMNHIMAEEIDVTDEEYLDLLLKCEKEVEGLIKKKGVT